MQKYKIMIVDDEHEILDNFTDFINHADMGFEVVASLDDGKEAIEYLKQHKVHIVFTDIRMYDVSGIDIARYVHENLPDVKVVLVSAYKEFDYALKAIEYKVEQYLSKPMNVRQLIELLNNLKQQLEQEASRKLFYSTGNNDYYIQLRRQLVSNVFWGVLSNKEEIISQMNSIGLSNVSGYVMVITVEKYDEYLNKQWLHGKDRLNVALKNIISMGATDVCPLFVRKNHTVVIVLTDGEVDIESYRNEITKNAQDILVAKIDVEVLYQFSNIYELNKNQVFTEWQSQFHFDHSELNKNNLLMEKGKLIFSCITSGDLSAAEKVLGGIMQESGSAVGLVSEIIENVVLLVNEYCGNKDAKTDFSQLKNARTQEEIISISSEILHSLADIVNANVNYVENVIIERAKRFINENYNKDISLEDVSDVVFFSPQYFSRFFKKHTGENYIDYIIGIRMSKAAELLKQNKYKIYEVSNMVGYKSSKYFSQMFKQYTGQTPIEYCRKSILH